MSANQRNIVGGVFRWLSVVLAAGIGAYLVVNAQRHANSNAHESAPAPEGAEPLNALPADATAESGASELTPEQILLFSSKSAPIEPLAGAEPEAGPQIDFTNTPFPDGWREAPFLHSSKLLAPGSPPLIPPSVVAEDGLLFGSKSGLILPPVVAPAPTTPLLGSSKRLEPLTSQPSGAKPAQSAPTDAKPKQP